jgi:ABC-type multidrug transport system ATPase subunit/pSer/pThr/pTyr-binding forkhead associated (FHA) protein
MGLIVQWPSGEVLIPEGKTFIVGRDSHADLQISEARCSRHHLRINFENGTWFATDLGSSNGSFNDGKRFESIRITSTTSISLGSENGILLNLSVTGKDSLSNTNADFINPNETTFVSREIVQSIAKNKVKNQDNSETSIRKRMTLSERLRIGRETDNELVISDLTVSRFHAEIVTNASFGHDLVDLNSSNGTYLNGKRIKRQTLKHGDLVTIGSLTTKYVGTALEPLETRGGFPFTVNSISVTINEKRLLNDVSFSVNPRSLTAVIGPSGAGKSTLLNAITGRRLPDSGEVKIGERSLYGNLSEFNTKIGFVPQSDLLHSGLETKRALQYGASLRFPKDTNQQERDKRVDEVLDELGLSERSRLRIDKLSGGQRKRTSVALELLTQPSLLFLDEPTSGLDPGLDRQVMNLLRNLADDGRTVFVVTHSVANLELCDNLLVMAPGGVVAYFGSPQGAIAFFDAQDWAEVFDLMNNPNSKFWQRMDQDKLRGQSKIASVAKSIDLKESDYESKTNQNWGYQCYVLIKRYFEVIRSDRQYSIFLVALPFLLSIVGYLSGDSSGLTAQQENLSLNLPPNPQARTLLLVLVLGTIFMGIATSIQELVKEQIIFDREASVGLSWFAYVLSKYFVLGVITILQSVIFTLLTLLGRPVPSKSDHFFPPLIEIVFVLSLLSFVSMALGIAISAWIKTSDVAMPAMVVATVSQVILSGSVPLRFDGILNFAGFPNPGYWAMNALASTCELGYLIGDTSNRRWDESMGNWMVSVSALGIIVLVLFALTKLGINRKRLT